MSEEDNKPAPVEVTLPEESITEVELSDKDAGVSEKSAKIETVKDKKEDSGPDPREKALNDLRAQYEYQRKVAEAERSARQKAEYYAQQQTQNVYYAHNQVQGSNLAIIENAISTTEQSAASAERDYAEAMAAGDYAAAAKAQRAIAQAETHLLQLHNGRSRLQEQLQEPTEGAVTAQTPTFEPQVPPPPPMEQVEMYAQRLTPKSAQWLREHPEAVEKIGKLTRAHQDAIEDGITPESKEYFNYIESRLGYGQEAATAERSSRAAPQRQSVAARRPDVSAPVTSSASAISPRSSSPNSMILDSSMVEIAILAFPDLPREKAIESYARNRAALIREGKL